MSRAVHRATGGGAAPRRCCRRLISSGRGTSPSHQNDELCLSDHRRTSNARIAISIYFSSFRGHTMKATAELHNRGQSLWLDNITRDLLTSGTLKRYISELSVTGLTSNPTILDHAIKNSSAYDAAIREKSDRGKSGEALFFELALEDVTRAAD